MAKTARKNQKIFGVNAGSQQRGVFGSLAAGLPQYSTDPEAIQSLANFEGGWYEAILGGNSPAIQDMNSLFFTAFYQLFYLFETGVPEWNALTTYYTGCFVSVAGAVYVSIANNNLNNPVTDLTKWKKFRPEYKVRTTTTTDTATQDDDLILVNPTGGQYTQSLPAATPTTGYRITVKNIHASNNVLISGNAGNIDGSPSVLLPPNMSSVFTWNGTSWSVTSTTSPTIPGTITAYGGSTIPAGWLSCNGAAVSRTTYAALYSAIGTNFGSGDGSTTFNLPDLRFTFLRGFGANQSATGSGSVATNNATFTGHGFTRTGRKIRLTSGTLNGLVANTDYYLIIVDANTLAFATSLANALAGTKISLTGVNSAVITQSEDLDVASRTALMPGGNTGANVGSYEEDAFQGHSHEVNRQTNTAGGGGGGRLEIGTGNFTSGPADFSPYGTAKFTNETRPKNVFVNYMIKF